LNQRIYDAGLKTQNCDTGFERFVRKFDQDQEMSATVAIIKGAHHEHGTAVSFTQSTRRCLLLDTTYGLSADEALWYTLLSQAKFQPRLKRPQREPGRLFYPAEYSHVFEKCWHDLDNPEDHPEFSQETSFTQDCMRHYTVALISMNLSDFEPILHAKAKESDVGIGTEAAISRILPIHDGPDLRGGIQKMSRSGSDTGSGAPGPG
jgi:hypothetical protein